MKPGSSINTLWFLLPLLAGAVPAPLSGRDVHPRDNTISAQLIEAIAPNSTTCNGAVFPKECATSETAARNLVKSFDTYKVTSLAEQAAIISLLALESGEFKYNINHWPGVPGQGTRNMQSPAFNAKYGASLPELSDKLKEVSNDPVKVLDLLNSNEEYSFGSGAWFLTTQCSADVRSALQSGSKAGWTRYIEECVGTKDDDNRLSYWKKAVQALGVQSS